MVADQFVGRSEEMRLLEEVLDATAHGSSQIIGVVGELGIGKTRLLREMVRIAELGGFLVLAGSASELERDLPFSVFVDALDEYLGGLEQDQLEGLGDEELAQLARVFPSVSLNVPGKEPGSLHERYRNHRAVRALLERLAETRPVALLLDDFHWADPASAELFGALLRRPPAAPVVTVAAFRPRQMSERLLTELERVHRDAVLTQIELVELTVSEVGEFLGEGVTARDAAVLYEECGGNPFYLEQLSRSLDRADEAVSTGGIMSMDLDVPTAVRASLSEEISVLSDKARLVLEGASVAGDPFEPELAAAAAAVSESIALDGVDELLQQDLVRITDVPRRFRFRHPLVRRTVYEGAPGAWRLIAHERCAAALTSRGAAAAAVAHHVEMSAKDGDRAAIEAMRVAGQEAARVAPLSAARWFGSALRLLPSAAPSEERVELLLARAASLAAVGCFAESRADLLACLKIVPRNVWDLRVRVTTACSVVEHLLGLRNDAHRHLTTALAEVGDGESVERVELMMALAVDGFHAVDFQAMCDWAGRAVSGAKPFGERSLLAAALALRAWAGAMAGEVDLAQAYCDEATDLVDNLADDELASRLSALAHLATADLFLDRFPAATRHARRALEIGRATGQDELFPQVVSMLGGSLCVQGKALEAGKLFDEAIEAARLSGNSHSLVMHLFNRSFAALLAGDLDIARAAADESFRIEGDMESGPYSSISAAVLSSVTLEQGQAERSVELLLTSAGGEELRQIGGGWRARFLEVLTRALLAIGRQSEAERVVALAHDCAEEVGLPTADAMASLATAELALHKGEPTTGAERALTAAAAFESVGAFSDAARARELAGRALAQAGEPDRAVVELELAAAAFDAFGALRYRDQAERELRRLGRRVQRRSAPSAGATMGIESLTERELQVAHLVVDRRTNPEIAAELFISQKTVETHLRNIFHKMNVYSRVELARSVEAAHHLTSSSS